MLLFGVLIYLCALPFSELRATDEAVYAAVAQDMCENGNWLNPHFQGMPCKIFPLYPWLVSLCSFFQTPTDFTVRLPAALAIFGMAIIAGITASKHRGEGCGIAAALIVMSSFVCMRMGLIAQSETLHAFLISAAWFYWYETGPQRLHWERAWGISLGLVALDMLNVGLKAPLFFYVPLLLATRPPRIKRQLQHHAHILWLLLYALLFYLWVRTFSQQPVFSWDSIVGGTADPTPQSFFAHLVIFPVSCLVYLLPWGLLAWMPFCLALRPLEPPGSVCGFLRAVVFSLFFFCWIMPGASPLRLLPVVAPLAVLISFNLEIVLQRGLHFWRWCINSTACLLVLGMFIAAFFWGLGALGRVTLLPVEMTESLLSNAFYAVLAILIFACAVLTIMRCFGTSPLLGIGWCAFGCRFLYLAVMLPLFFGTVEDRRYAAGQIRGQFPPPVNALQPQREVEETFDDNSAQIKHIYLVSEASYSAISFYLGRPVIRITNPTTDLPAHAPVVYMLSTTPPTIPERSWKAISPESNFTMKRQFHAEMNSSRREFNLKITREPSLNPAELPGYRPPAQFRLYKGTLRHTPSETKNSTESGQRS